MPQIADDPDDVDLLARAVLRERPAYWLALPELSRHRLVDNGHLRRRFVIEVGELATLHDGYVEQREITRPDNVDVG